MKTKILLLSATLFGEMLAAPVLAGDWTITDIGTLGGSRTFGWAINDLGQVVGESRLPGDTDSHSFIYANGVMQDIVAVNSGYYRSGNYGLNNLGVIASCTTMGVCYPAIYNPHTLQLTALGSLGSSSGFTGTATAINDFGVTVGYSYLNSVNRHAFVYLDGHMSDLGSFGGYSCALGLNNAGTIVGFASSSATGFSRPALWSNGSIVDISQGMEGEAEAINDSGEVVGAVNNQAFLWRNGALQLLGLLPGAQFSYGKGINNRGDVVGDSEVVSSTHFDPVLGYTVTNYAAHAFLYHDGNMLDLNDMVSTNSGYVMSEAFGINNSEQILCWGTDDGGQNYHSFIVQAPEPNLCSLVAGGASAWFVYRRKRGITRSKG